MDKEKLRDAHQADLLTRLSGKWTVADDSEKQDELDKLLAEFDSIEELETAANEYWDLGKCGPDATANES